MSPCDVFVLLPDKLQSIMEECFIRWSFDVFNLETTTHGRSLLFAGRVALQRGQCFAEFHIIPSKTRAFLAEAVALYASEQHAPCHISLHAAGVLWQCGDPQMYALRAMLLHSADISNPSKAVGVSHQWSVRALTEYFRQGDQEAKLNLPIDIPTV